MLFLQGGYEEHDQNRPQLHIEEKHRLRATTPLFYFEWQAPNRFKTTILEGTDDDLRWDRKDGRVWIQT